MYQILYTSKAVVPFKDEELKVLLEVARRNNSEKSITGMLLYCNSNFIQMLEGDEQDLEELFSIISQDGRHTDIARIIDGQIEHQQFPDWSMGYKFLTPRQLTSLDQHDNIDVSSFIRKTQPFKLLKLLSAKSWN